MDDGEEGHMAGPEWLQRNDVGLGRTIAVERSSTGQEKRAPLTLIWTIDDE